jgi:glycosyltransferase involved in cell wall biosynthesis
VLDLAYPNGREGDWDDETVRDARATGYRSALTTIEGSNDPARLDPMRMRRISVGDDSTPVFAVRVSGILTPLRAVVRSILSRPRHRPFPPAADRPGTGSTPARRSRLSIAFIGGRGVGSAYSGIERYYEEVGSRLAARGNRLLIYTRPHFSGSGRSHEGMDLVPLPTIRWKHLETLVHSILSTIDVCFRRVDIVQYHALGSSPLAWIPRLMGKKTVVSVRGLDWQRAKWGRVARSYLRFCERTSVSCPNRTAVVSKGLRDHYMKRFGRDVRYIPNGVGEHAILPPDTIRQWGLRERNYFLFAGRISPEKRPDLLIEAHRSLSSDYPLVIAGGSSYSERYIDQLRAGAGRDVIFTGFLKEGPTLAELYSNALAFVLPSQMEGLSVALLEALSYGAPALVSDIPENRELVDECGGFVFKMDDLTSLTEALERIVADPAGAMRVGERAREVVRARFNWDRIALESESFYRELLRGSSTDDQQPIAGIDPREPDVPVAEDRSLPRSGQG